LIFSYLFRQAHNSFILHVDSYIGGAKIVHSDYLWGSFIGVIITGIFLDLVMQNRRFLTVFLLNLVMLSGDIYLFTVAKNADEQITPSPFVTGLLGAVLSSNDLIYLVMIPMYMAKNHSERIANEQGGQAFRLCYAGTIVGVVLALCCVGKFLFSQNLAIFLNYCTRNPESKNKYGWNDFILASLITIANLIIIKPVWEEYKLTRLYKWWKNRNANPDPIDES